MAGKWVPTCQVIALNIQAPLPRSFQYVQCEIAHTAKMDNIETQLPQPGDTFEISSRRFHYTLLLCKDYKENEGLQNPQSYGLFQTGGLQFKKLSLKKYI